MKILFALSSLSAGGAERVASTMCNTWIRNGIEITLVPTFSKKGICFYDIDPKVKITYLADFVPVKNNNVIDRMKRLLALRKLILKESPDIILSYLTNVNVAVLLASIKLKIPVIVCEHSIFSQMVKSPFLKMQVFIAYKWATKVVVLTNKQVNYFKRKLKSNNIELVPNPIPPDLPLQKALLNKTANCDKYTLIAVGRLIPLKQFDLLIKVFSELASTHPNWEMCILGEGKERSKLESIVEQFGLNKRIRLPGRTGKPWDEMAKADLFVLSSLIEGFPCALIEAMALGLPCISTDCSDGVIDISNNGSDVIIVPSNDKDKLLEKIAILMDDNRLRIEMGKKAFYSVTKRYSIDSVIKKWNNIFEQVLIKG